jgi:aromatic amino acid transport protein AroP
VSAAVFFVAIILINLSSVKAFGEAEFWFALIKVVAIIGMILLGLYLLVSGQGGEQAAVSNLWRHGGFFPDGVEGLVMVLAVIMFSFGGLELVGIAAAEAAKAFLSVNKRGVPVLAIAVSALITLLRVLVNYLAPHRALEMLMALVVSALVINWAMISLSHLRFRQSLDKRGLTPGV